MTDIAIGIIITFLFVCMAILFCAILIKVYVSKIKKYNQLLFEKQLEQQKAVNQAALEAQEETLNNIALDLHDDAGQRLTVLNLQVEQLKQKNPEMTAALQPIKETVRDISHNLRNLSHSLTTNSLKKLSLVQAINEELQRVKRLEHISFKSEMEQPAAFNFSTEEKVIIYRIFQELLNNMLKHSRATEFVVRLKSPDLPIFTFIDNGVGFDIDSKVDSNGLENVRSRASLINYELKIDSKKQQGTTTILRKQE
ncbi:hypothetical protein BST97_08405 [Nonlabens spongiae]|uniref:histidine kinase n=1 Tax=Nonlabens spongiae TaxID=331648 RepID=A0A1W6MKL0_9FLAO|nr:histidine kinase [Nonlabens spongiae]ARN78019.1 hypothetical protein BST97_08405 [Nonlabens spongiae]